MRFHRTIIANLVALGILLSISTPQALGQTVSRIFAFTGNNSSGCPYYVTPTQGRDGLLYGTTSGFCYERSAGSIFRIGTDGIGGVLFKFDDLTEQNPTSGLTLATDGNFYGVIGGGGSFGLGVLYRITPEGVYTAVYDFQGIDDGESPNYPPVQASDSSLYGVTGGYYGILYKYSSAGHVSPIFALNPDGSQGYQFSSPPLQGADGNFYLTTAVGGLDGCGTILKLTSAGIVLHQYDFRCKKYGSWPAGLMQATDGNFYGTTLQGGINTTGCTLGCGTLFKMTQEGAVTLLHKFGNNHLFDGAYPQAGLVEGTDGKLYGATPLGGNQRTGNGTLYNITTSGTMTLLHSFWGNDPLGNRPDAPPTQHTNGKFYGTTPSGGAHGSGTIFSLDMSLGPFVAFVQPTGKVGGTAQLLGQGLIGTSSVTFNGVSASFVVNSDNSMTAVVPSGATTGPVVVTTPSGILRSNKYFRISQ